jgi:prolyl-tRNA editing enzyme YbaK/EbsC (Cys-tRNA(Pro) deacylase)
VRKKIQESLLQKGLKVKVIEFPASTKTAVDAARTIGCEVGQIVKSLIFKTKQTNRALLVLTSGSNRVNEKKISQIVHEDIEKGDADFTRAVTGFAIGHKEIIETFIDEDLFQYKEIWAAAGTPYASFCIEPSSLKKITNGKVISVK